MNFSSTLLQWRKWRRTRTTTRTRTSQLLCSRAVSVSPAESLPKVSHYFPTYTYADIWNFDVCCTYCKYNDWYLKHTCSCYNTRERASWLLSHTQIDIGNFDVRCMDLEFDVFCMYLECWLSVASTFIDTWNTGCLITTSPSVSHYLSSSTTPAARTSSTKRCSSAKSQNRNSSRYPPLVFKYMSVLMQDFNFSKRPLLLIRWVCLRQTVYTTSAYCNALQLIAVCCSLLQYVAVCCSMLQYVAVCCSMLQSQYHRHSTSAFCIQVMPRK